VENQSALKLSQYYMHLQTLDILQLGPPAVLKLHQGGERGKERGGGKEREEEGVGETVVYN
jgi:hypothetical protein